MAALSPFAAGVLAQWVPDPRPPKPPQTHHDAVLLVEVVAIGLGAIAVIVLAWYLADRFYFADRDLRGIERELAKSRRAAASERPSA